MTTKVYVSRAFTAVRQRPQNSPSQILVILKLRLRFAWMLHDALTQGRVLALDRAATLEAWKRP